MREAEAVEPSGRPTPSTPITLMMVAGEASGDLHGARLLSELHEMDPQLRAFGLGSAEMRSAGAEVLSDSSQISVVGISEALKVLPEARKIFQHLLEEADRRQADAAILIDSPDFNLRLAKALKKRDKKVIYYISPQVWAWREGRVRAIRKFVDRMLVVFPFEAEFYRAHGVDAVHVGHPLVDEVPRLPHVWDQSIDPHGAFRLALLPGSRRSEIAANLPVMLSAVQRLAQELPIEVSLIKAGSVDRAQLEAHLQDLELEIEITSGNRFDILAASHLAICASGTATLEVGLLTTPMVVVYRVSLWSYALGRMLVRLPHVSLVNLVLESEVVPELIQHDATPEAISRECSVILQDRVRIQTMRSQLGRLWQELGESGASRRAALEVLRSLNRAPGERGGASPG